MLNGVQLAVEDSHDERQVLAGLLANPAKVVDVGAVLTPDLFGRERYGQLFALITRLAGTVPDDALGYAVIKADQRFHADVLDLVSGAPLDVGYHAAVVAERARMRQLATAAEQLQRIANSGAAGPDEVDLVVERAQAAIDDIRRQGARARALDPYPELDWSQVWAGVGDEPDWLIEPLLERGRLYALWSIAGVGKSLLTLEIAAALATGRPVLGNTGRDPIHVLYVDMENSPSDLVERLSAFGYRPEQLGHLHYLSFPSLPALDSPAGGAGLLAAAERHLAEVVVIDTVSRIIAGKENDSDTFHQLYRCALAPLKARGITTIRLDHAGKDTERGQRGSSAKDSDVDVVWQLSQLTAVAYRLTRGKSRNNHHPESIDLQRRFSPLRHEITRETGLDPAVAELVEHLDRLDIPVDLSRPKTKELLTANGIKGSNQNLQSAINYRRKTCPGQAEGERS